MSIKQAFKASLILIRYLGLMYITRFILKLLNFYKKEKILFITMKLLIFTVLVSAVVAVYATGDAPGETNEKWITQERAGQEQRDKLLDKLLVDYKTYSYPENTTVKLGAYLLNLELDQSKHVMHSDVWLKMMWTDNRLSWDEKETGVKLLRIPSEKIWTPDVTLYNSASQEKRLNCWSTNAIIYSNGKVLMVPPCHLQSYCNLTLDHEPYGEQVCHLKFGSWTFDGLTQGLDFYENTTSLDAANFQGFPTYEITKNTAVRTEKKYDCCVEPYLDLTFTLGLTKIQSKPQTCAN